MEKFAPCLLLIVSLVVASQAFWLNDFTSNDEVKFNLYTRKVKNAAVKSNNQLSGLKKFNPKAKTYFIIHGWNGGGDKADGWAQKMLDALLKKFDVNVFVVNWEEWAKNFNYLASKALCDDAGKRIADFIKKLERKTGASRQNMHLIGHSLGGQVAGFTGANLRLPKIARITGLDTSGIAFNCLFDPNDCLDPSDADFVDEIHSLVSALPKGHADYYPIPKDIGKAVADTKIIGAHWLAADYFTKSIEAGSCAFKSKKCTTYATYTEGGCSRGADNSLGFYAKKPSSKPPNRFFITIDMDKPC